MFGGSLSLPIRNKKPHPRNPNRQGILAPGSIPGQFAYFAREPNTDYDVQMIHYKQRKKGEDAIKEEQKLKQKLKESIDIKYTEHVNKKRLQFAIRDRVNEKWQAYEKSVEERRRRLHQMLYEEERQFYYETIDTAQRGVDRKMEEMKQRAQMLKAKREEERLKVVHQKRLEQYSERCLELRPALAKKHLVECKYSQLQQIRENEARREADREIEQMWHDLNLKEIEAKKEREVQEMLDRRKKDGETVKVWDKQVKGQEMLKKEMEELAREEHNELLKLVEEVRRQEIKELEEKRKKREQAAKTIEEQIEIQKKLQAQRKSEEKALENAFTTLTQLEIEREKDQMRDNTTQLKRETAMYRRHLKELDEERKREDKRLEELLELHKKEIEKKADEAKCKIYEAKQALQKNVLQERAEQVRYKKQLAEEQLKQKEAENELLRMAYETNERLQAESDRIHKEAAHQYCKDLTKQIEYANVLRQREQEELKRQLEKGMEEEENYRNFVEQIVSGEIDVSAKHPCRVMLEMYDCHCPKPAQNTK